ncbi:MAG: hypothetical protein JSW27_04080 [Phycisphaerales bacterium]|nr:MAG: hypothetical protein JSW27_04080 [Phycisphaerales bacterium]
MKRGRRITIAFGAVVALVVVLTVALQIWLWKSPLVVFGDPPGGEIFDRRTAVGRVFAEVQACGEQQKDLYGCIEAYREKYGRLPKDMDELADSVYQAKSFDDCPVGLSWYVVHFENYGKPDAMLIEEAEDKHPTAFKLCIRGMHPQVQTMGDGTIRLFRDGKLATINARK